MLHFFRANIPLVAVVKLTIAESPLSCTKSTVQNRIDAFWKVQDILKVDDRFKATAFPIITVPLDSEHNLKENSTNIYDELSSLVYDIEDKRRQHRNYLEHVQVFDVTEESECLPIENYADYNEYFQNIPYDHITVPIILKALIHQVDVLFEKTEITSLEPLSQENIIEPEMPFLCQEHEKIVLEKQDELMQIIYKSGNLSYINYLSTIDTLTNLFEWNQYWKTIPNCNNLLSTQIGSNEYTNIEYALNVLHLSTPTYVVPKKLSVHSSRGSSDDLSFQPSVEVIEYPETHINNIFKILNPLPISVPEYFVDYLTAEALQQQMVLCKQQFDNCHYKYIAETDSVLIQFKNNKEIFMETQYEQVLTTKLCFRDFYSYVVPEQKEWLQNEENRYDKRIISGSDTSKINMSNKNIDFNTEIFSFDFYLNRSLKKHGNEGFTGDFELPKEEPKIVIVDVKGFNIFEFFFICTFKLEFLNFREKRFKRCQR